MHSEEDFFSEFYYPDESETENEGNVELLSFSRACKIPEFGLKFLKLSSLSLEFYSKVLARSY